MKQSPISWTLLYVYGGILFAPQLDAACELGTVTVRDDGAFLLSEALDVHARHVLGLDRVLRVRGPIDGHRSYLPWHREHVFNTHLAVRA